MRKEAQNLFMLQDCLNLSGVGGTSVRTATYKNHICDSLLGRETGSKADWIDKISVDAKNQFLRTV